MKITLEPAFVLHTKPYRETSLIVELLTQHHGKISGIAQSARGQRSRFKNSMVPFSPLFVSFFGKTELVRINAVEPHGGAFFLQGDNLFSGIYLNELLTKLLPRSDPFPQLFENYREAILQLQLAKKESQVILRIFEKKLLAEMGYGLSLSEEATGNKVVPDKWYTYRLDQGIVACSQEVKNEPVFLGKHLLAIEADNFDSPEILKEARRLMRFVVGNLLGNRVLKSRDLFR